MQGQLQATNTHAVNTEKSTGRLSKTMGGLSAPAEKASRSIGGLGKTLLLAGGAFAGFEMAKSAIQSTVQLGEATIKLTAITGMDAKTASTWIEVMKARGAATRQVSMAFITLSKNIFAAQESATKQNEAVKKLAETQQVQRQALEATHASQAKLTALEKTQVIAMTTLQGKTATATAAFHDLGISQKELQGASTESVLLMVADGLEKLKSSSERAALAQKLFGRGAQAIIPVLAQGRAGVEAMLASAQRYGAFLPNNIKQSEAMVQTQFKLNYAMDGMKIAFTEAVLPSLMKGVTALLAFIVQMRSGTGVGGQFAQILKAAFGAVKSAVEAVFPVFKLLGGVLLGLTHILGTQLTGALVAVGVALAAGNPLIAGILALLIIITHLGTVAKGFQILWSAAWTEIKRITGSVVIFILGLFSSMLGGVAQIANVFSHLPGPVGDAFAKIRDAARSGQTAIDRFRHTVSVWDGETKVYSKSIAQHFETLATKVGVSIVAARDAIHNGSKLAAKYAIGNFNAIAGQIQLAMSSGQISAQQGAKLIAQALQDAMTAFGGAKIPGIGKVLAAAYPDIPKFTATSPALQATGGLIQVGRKGAAGRDNVPMNAGGVPIVVGEGEQVAVFTRHQQEVANQALAPYGGLSGLFGKVNKPHYMATGGLVGRAYATGGPTTPFTGTPTLSYGQLEALWIAAGGPANVANVMAAIAEAESGGADVMQQGQPFATTGWGYWQITPGGPQYLDPMTNARTAVSDYNSRGFSPWTTYNTGAYRQFLQGNVPPSAAGIGASGPTGAAAAWKNILAPKVTGTGTIPGIVRAALTMLTGQANKYGQAHMPASAAGGAAAIGGLPGGLGSFDGLPVASWIVPILQWAAAHGWSGSITSGYRSPSQVISGPIVAPQGQSNHNFTAYPGGAIDVGGPGAQAAGQALWNVIANYPGTPNLVWGGPTIGDWGHFSATGHMRGGFVKALSAATGLLTSGGLTGAAKNVPTYRKTPPRPSGKTTIGLKSLAGAGMGPINKAMDQLNNLVGPTGDTARLTERYGAFDSLFQALHPNQQYVISPPSGGAPYVDDVAVQDSLNELLQLQAWEQQIIADYQQVQKLVPYVLHAIQVAVDTRVRQVAAIRAKIRDNLAKINAIEKYWIPLLQKRKPIPAAQIAELKKQVGALKADNSTLGGSATSIGTTGRIGALATQITDLRTRWTGASDMLTATQGLTGDGGNLASEQVKLIGLQGQIKPLQDWVASKSGDLATQLAAAGPGAAAGTASADLTAQLQQQLALQEQLTTQAQQALAVSQAQYGVLQGFPFAGSFGGGGIVGGPIGSPQVAVVHGGEAIGMPGDVAVHLHFANGMEWLRGFVTAEVAKKDRSSGRIARRELPGGGGGI